MAIDAKTKAAARAAKTEGTQAKAGRARQAKENGGEPAGKIERYVSDGVRAAGGKVTDLNADQRKRAVEAPKKKAGLRGKALGQYVLDGTNTRQQADAARGRRTAEATTGGGGRNVTRSKDPEAVELAQEAKALAPDVKSAFLPKDARAFIDEVLKGRSGAALLSIPGEGEDDEGSTITLDGLKKFAVKGEKDTDVRRHLTRLGSGTRLWGRKLGLFILAQHARDQK